MKDNLLQLIQELQSDKRLIAFDEAATKLVVILRILSSEELDWKIHNIDEVHPEYTVGSKKVDYSLKVDNQNKIFIEAKRAGEDLERHQEQLLNYSFQEGVPIAILTNGITWWFYLPLLEGNWEKRRFYTIEIYDQNPEDMAKKLIDFLSKENVSSGKALTNARTIHKSKQKTSSIKETLPKAWVKLISEPDELLVDLVAEATEKICGYRPDNPTVETFILTRLKMGKIAEIQPQQKKTTFFPSTRIYRKPIGDYSGKSILSFQFKGRSYPVKNWKNLLLKLGSVLYEIQRDQFSNVLRLRGRKRPYLAKDPRELFRGLQIPGTDLYAEVNLSANSIVKMCLDMIGLFGYSEDDFSIEVRQK